MKTAKRVKKAEIESLDAVRDLICDLPSIQIDSVEPRARIEARPRGRWKSGILSSRERLLAHRRGET